MMRGFVTMTGTLGNRGRCGDAVCTHTGRVLASSVRFNGACEPERLGARSHAQGRMCRLCGR